MTGGGHGDGYVMDIPEVGVLGGSDQGLFVVSSLKGDR